MGQVTEASFTPEQLVELRRAQRVNPIKTSTVQAQRILLPLAYLTGLAFALSVLHVEFGFVLGAFLILRGLPPLVIKLSQK